MFGCFGASPAPAPTPKVFPGLNKLWQAPPSSMVVDLPRLVRRVTVTANNENLVFQPLFSDPDKSVKRSFTLIIDLFVSLFRLFQSNSQSLEQRLAQCIAQSDKLESESVCLEMLDILKQESAQSFGALRMINQSVVLICVYELKTSLLARVETKDVRTEDGWRVNLDVSVDGFTITHVRKELAENKFTLQWAIQMEFDSDVTTLRKTVLELQSLTYVPPLPSAKAMAKQHRELCIGTRFTEVSS